MQSAVMLLRLELRDKQRNTLVQDALKLIEETKTKLRSSEDGKDKKRP